MKKNADKGKSEGGNSEFHTRRKFSKNSEIEAYLSTHYEFRYRRMNSSDFTKVGRYEINTLRRELDNDVGIITSSDNLYSIIESSFSPRVNPIQEYFNGLPLVDIGNSRGNYSGNSDSCSHGSSGNGNNEHNNHCDISSLSLKAIPELASCVVVRNSDKWLPYLTKWLVAVVANAMDDRECRNHTCLVLTGEQGKFKTTFLDLLCHLPCMVTATRERYIRKRRTRLPI